MAKQTGTQKENAEKRARILERMYKLRDMLGNQFSQSPEGKEHAYLVKVVLPSLQDDNPIRSRFIFPQLVASLDQYEKHFRDSFNNAVLIEEMQKLVDKYRKKGRLFDQNDFDYFAHILLLIQSGQIMREEFKEFTETLKDIEKHASAHPEDKAILHELQSSDILRHIENYSKELDIWRKVLQNIKHDDADWTYLKRFASQIDAFTDGIEHKFGDKENAKVIRDLFKDGAMDKTGAEQAISKIVADMQNPANIQKTEKLALKSIAKLVHRRTKALHDSAYDLKKEMAEHVKERIKFLIEKHNKELKQVMDEIEKINASMVIAFELNDEARAFVAEYKKRLAWNIKVKQWIFNMISTGTILSQKEMAQINEYVGKHIPANEEALRQLARKITRLSRPAKINERNLAFEMKRAAEKVERLEKAA